MSHEVVLAVKHLVWRLAAWVFAEEQLRRISFGFLTCVPDSFVTEQVCAQRKGGVAVVASVSPFVLACYVFAVWRCSLAQRTNSTYWERDGGGLGAKETKKYLSR
jgi:hypothetical protein